MKKAALHKLCEYAKFVYIHRRIIGAFIGTALMFTGYTREADFVHKMSSIE